MLTGDQLFAARTQAGMTQQELADVVGATQRSVGNWERAERVPKGAEQKVRTALAAYLTEGSPQGSGLSEVSDALLLAEIARRFDRGREDVGDDERSAATSQAPGSGAPNTDELDELRRRPSKKALDPTVPDEAAARSAPGKGKAQSERERQDDEGES